MQRVVIVGAGQAGFQVALSLRQSGFAGAIALVGNEGRLPYQRPPLSKAYLKEPLGFDRLVLRQDAFFAENRIDLHLADPATGIERADGALRLASGARLAYDHLVLATGARNRTLALEGVDLPGVHELRDAGDAERFRDALGGAARLVIVGGGFIGLEVAASARARGIGVTVIEAAGRLMGRVVSPAVSAFFLTIHRAMGTTVLLNESVRGIRGADRAGSVETSGGSYAADCVLIAAGVVPNDELARAAGLTVSAGIRVDRFMATDDPKIRAIGDCAVFESRHAGGLVRLESVQNAIDQARCVADCIMGGSEPYDSVPWFWSDQGTSKLQIAGITSGADDIHVVGSPNEGRFAAFCFRDDALIGIETVNRPGDHMAGRKLLSRDFRVARAEMAAHDFDLRAHLKALPSGE